MAYDKDEVFNDVIEAIKTNKLKNFSYISGYVAPSEPTLYEFFPIESKRFKAIKKELDLNRINSKSKMRNKWEESDNPTLQIAAFKLIATDDEQKALSTNYQKTEHSGEVKTTEPNINLVVNDKTFNLKED